MKKTISLLSNLLLSVTLFWGVPAVAASELVETEVVDFAGYCHMKFAPMNEATLSRDRRELDADAGRYNERVRQEVGHATDNLDPGSLQVSIYNGWTARH